MVETFILGLNKDERKIIINIILYNIFYGYVCYTSTN